MNEIGEESMSTGNADQQKALAKLLDALEKVRGFKNVQYTRELRRTELRITLISPPGFPVISIGRKGAFDMPDIPSYPETSKVDSLTYPGSTHFEACLFGDKYESRQRAKAANKLAKSNILPSILLAVFS